MNFSTPQQLYEALLKQPQNETIAPYMERNGIIGKELTNHNGMNFINIKLWINKDKKGNTTKTPCFLKRSGLKIPFSIWNSNEVEAHNEFLKNTHKEYSTKTLLDECQHFIVLPSNCEDTNKGYLCIDIDSKDELFRLYKEGFPVFDIPFTLSSSKKLPHFWIETQGREKQILGKDLKEPRDFDLISNYVYEKKSSIVYGSSSVPAINRIDYNKWFGLEINGDPKSYGNIREERLNKTIKKPVKAVGIYDKYDQLKDIVIDKGDKKFEPTWETIPFKELSVLLNTLDCNKYGTYREWFKLLKCVICQLNKHSNTNDYVGLINKFYEKHPKFSEEWKQENFVEFVKCINAGNYNTEFTIGHSSSAEWLYSELEKENRDMWKQLAFRNHRDLCPIEFKKLDFNESIEIFNKRCCYIGGKTNMYCEYNSYENEFIFSKKNELKDKYSHYYYMETAEVYDKQSNQMKTKESRKKFIPMWLDSEYKKCFNGGTCFNPPPSKCNESKQFNLYTGFEVDRQVEYNEKVNAMTKEELEEELKPVLDHLRYLSGEDKTEEVYQYQLKYFSHLIKYPAIIPRVALVWISVPGCGKNLWLNAMENIMGDKYYYSSASSREILGDFNCCVRGRLLLNLNEFKCNFTLLEALKELITEKKLSTREKHKNDIRIENRARIVITSNLKNPLVIEFKDRRFMVVRCNPITTCDEFKESGYFSKLTETFNSLYIQKCFVRYCREFVSVTENYNFEQNIVKTSEYKMLQSNSVPACVRFLRYWYEKLNTDGKGELTAGKLFQLYLTWKEEEQEKLDYSHNKFINEIEAYRIATTGSTYLSYNPQAMIHIITGKKQKYYQLDKDRAVEYFKDNGVAFSSQDEYDFVDTCEPDND